jgi:hypothetical protein
MTLTLTLTDKIAELSDQTDIPMNLTEALCRLLASRRACRRKGQTFEDFILSTPLEDFLTVLEPLVWELQAVGLI